MINMTIKEIVALTGLTQAEFAKKYGIPKRTLESWIMGDRKPPEYTLELLRRVVEADREPDKN